MRFRWTILPLICLLAAFFAVQWTAASSSGNDDNLALRVDEAATRVLLDGDYVRVSLATNNPTNRKESARVHVELLDPDNRVRASAEQDKVFDHGANAYIFELPLRLQSLGAKELERILWYRLRYRITLAANAFNPPASPIEGIISLSQITPDIFELRIIASGYAREGMLYRARIRAAHPLSQQPATGVKIEAAIALDENDKKTLLKASGTTNADGYAVLDFNLPRKIETDEGKLEVVGQRGALLQKTEADIHFDQQSRILIGTDKPLYQPGQTLHARALLFSPAMRALAGAATTFSIEDPDGTTVFRAPLTASRFGIANADWQIPDTTRLGDYSLHFSRADESSASYQIKITRYEVPNFAVNVKPDRPYYLPTENARVEVSADYLFGQPVMRGHVRLVRETEREWNYREQKYDVKEAETYEGDTDQTKRFVARIDLAKEQAELKDDHYSRFRDVPYAAYLTDLTTNRTEQRRFNLRITRDAIHIYAIENSNAAKNAPLNFYLTTFYADGTPAPCEVNISQTHDSSTARQKFNQPSRDDAPQILRTVKTNRYGLAKISGLAFKNEDADNERVAINFTARDDAGQSGNFTNEFSIGLGAEIGIETNRALYRPGESIKAEIVSYGASQRVVLDVVRDAVVLRSQTINLREGHALVVLPYGDDFKDELTLVAYSGGVLTPRSLPFGTRTVLYPRKHGLELDAQPVQSTYRPGEDAQVNFRVQAADGRRIESALGVVVFDKAIEERARTDAEFGGNHSYGFAGSLRALSGDAQEFAGVTLKDLEQLNLSQPVPDDLNLLAEVLLRKSDHYYPDISRDDAYASLENAFADATKLQLAPIVQALETHYARTVEYPADQAQLRRILQQSGIDFNAMSDPWRTPYRAVFSIERGDNVLEFKSAGADKRFDTADDFTAARKSWPYFRLRGEAIERAVRQYHERTGSFIRDEQTLSRELERAGLKPDEWRDAWSEPYKFEFGINENNYLVAVKSGGTDKGFAREGDDDTDDFTIWTASIDYFTETRARIAAALNSYLEATKRFPQNDAELSAALRRSNINADDLRDPWQHPYYATFKISARYTDRVSIESRARYGEAAKQHTNVTPITQRYVSIALRSRGADGTDNTADDFTAANFTSALAEQSGTDAKPRPPRRARVFPGATGAITGVVTDPNGAVIAGVIIKATSTHTSQVYETQSNAEGEYTLGNLPAGTYALEFASPGFMSLMITDARVFSSNITQVAAALEVGSAGETVEVTSSASELVQTSSMQMLRVKPAKSGTAMMQSAQASTPPLLRDDFPETLVWQPALETDREGRAALRFKLAGNITTWKMSIIGSTIDGEIGTAESELRAFQPFFIEHNPPPVLTEGDQLALPITLRNYLDKAQTVKLEIKPESWFKLLDPPQKQLTVAAGDAARETFELQAIASIKNGAQRITATAANEGDAVEKHVSVHPNGEERAATSSDIFGDSTILDAQIPANAINNTARAELKIYPNLMAHVIEGIEGILQRPDGCGEQTISAAYPSLLVLRSYQAAKSSNTSPVTAKARRYLQVGYERLLNYRTANGGFSYWGRGEADQALTAYALKFLCDAREVIDVDERTIEEAHAWLIKQQRTDGSWAAYNYNQTIEDKRRTALLTAYVARVLASIPSTQNIKTQTNSGASTQQRKSASVPAPTTASLKRALDYLQQRTNEFDEPYLIASYALAALDAGEAFKAAKAQAKLRFLAREEAGMNYWSLETNTPFYGWGVAGRVEATALAVRALARDTQGNSATHANDAMINRGLLFLLRRKDRYGVWYSTQATVNVLETLVTLLQKREPANALRASATNIAGATTRAESAAGAIDIVVNGQHAASLTIPTGELSLAPLAVDVSRFLSPGSNRVELRRAKGAAQATAQLVATYYVPWPARSAVVASNTKPIESNALRLAVSYDKTQARVGEEITCRVNAARTGFRGYGMMLAEIGLPPGAETDRASLEDAMKKSGWSFSRYDVLPDRVIAYLWPRAGGVSFDFKFRTRFHLAAQSAPSVLYDYYNPSANAVGAPQKFVVR